MPPPEQSLVYVVETTSVRPSLIFIGFEWQRELTSNWPSQSTTVCTTQLQNICHVTFAAPPVSHLGHVFDLRRRRRLQSRDADCPLSVIELLQLPLQESGIVYLKTSLLLRKLRKRLKTVLFRRSFNFR
mgnify:CR=1 FL=1